MIGFAPRAYYSSVAECLLDAAWRLSPFENWLHSLLTRPSFWDAFLPAVIGALVGAAAGAGIAFALERHRRLEEKRIQETGLCQALVFNMLQLLKNLIGLRHAYFLGAVQQLKRRPKWNEVLPQPSVEQEAPPFSAGDYMFLLDNEKGVATGASRLIQRVINDLVAYRITLGEIRLRERLFEQIFELQGHQQFLEGTAAAMNNLAVQTMAKRVDQLTGRIAFAISQHIEELRDLIPKISTAVYFRFPGKPFAFPPRHFPPLTEYKDETNDYRQFVDCAAPFPVAEPNENINPPPDAPPDPPPQLRGMRKFLLDFRRKDL